MKRFVCVLLIALLFVFSATSLAQVDLGALERANMLYAIPEVYPSFVHSVSYYDMETGDIAGGLDCYVSLNENSAVRYTYVFPNGDVQVWGGGGGYGYASGARTPYICCFVGSAYEEQMLFHSGQRQGDFLEGTVVTSEEVSSDGKPLIVLEAPIREDDANFGQFAGQTLVSRYTVDPDSLIILAGETYVRGGGADRLFSKFSLEIGRTYELPFDLSLITEPQTTREAHVISDPGTDAEFDWVFEAPLDIPIVIYTPAGYELYQDAACTVPDVGIQKDANGNYPMTSTAYCGPVA